jgi:gamma-glutamyl-gamma-aminobutyrate hydrolase PuuD
MKRIGVSFRFRDKVLPYELALRLAGLEPVAITPDSSPLTQDIDGLLLTGGSDIEPARYGQVRGPHTGKPDPGRDELELNLLKNALDTDLPVLAICRGMQLFNVFHGGTLIQHLVAVERHDVRSKPAHDEVHSVRICPRTTGASIFGAGDYGVNSRHHQGVDQVGEGLVVSGISDDALVEAIERPDRRFAVAVQWHPEDRIEHSAADRRLFEAFAQAVRH